MVVLPVLRFGLLCTVLAMLHSRRRPAWLGSAFRHAQSLQVWAMADVFLLGLAVAYARLRTTIAIEVGDGAWCFHRPPPS